MRVENKVAILTGAGSGIGRETAHLFGKEGAKVVVVDVNEKAGHFFQKKPAPKSVISRGMGDRTSFGKGDFAIS